MGQRCGKHAPLVKELLDTYKEIRRAYAWAGDTFVEVYRSKTDSWTLLLTFKNGLTCIVGAGDRWEDIKAPTEGRDL